jgi:PhnB protein
MRDVASVLLRASASGATTVTEPTPSYGEVTLRRMLDDWQNIWWLWAPAPGQPDPVDNFPARRGGVTTRSPWVTAARCSAWR